MKASIRGQELRLRPNPSRKPSNRQAEPQTTQKLACGAAVLGFTRLVGARESTAMQVVVR